MGFDGVPVFLQMSGSFTELVANTGALAKTPHSLLSPDICLPAVGQGALAIEGPIADAPGVIVIETRSRLEAGRRTTSCSSTKTSPSRSKRPTMALGATRRSSTSEGSSSERTISS